MSQAAENLETSDYAEPVLSVECKEPEGTVIRHIRPLIFTPTNLKKFFIRSKKYRTLLGQEVGDSYERFLQVLIREGPSGMEPTGLFWVIDEFVGVFFLTNIYPEQDALVHYTFLDGRHRGRHNLTRRMLEYVFKKYNFRRLSAEVPAYLKDFSFDFIESVGFRREGTKRSAILYKDHWFDVKYYGILREEVLWDTKKNQLQQAEDQQQD